MSLQQIFKLEDTKSISHKIQALIPYVAIIDHVSLCSKRHNKTSLHTYASIESTYSPVLIDTCEYIFYATICRLSTDTCYTTLETSSSVYNLQSSINTALHKNHKIVFDWFSIFQFLDLNCSLHWKNKLLLHHFSFNRSFF